MNLDFVFVLISVFVSIISSIWFIESFSRKITRNLSLPNRLITLASKPFEVLAPQVFNSLELQFLELQHFVANLSNLPKGRERASIYRGFSGFLCGFGLMCFWAQSFLWPKISTMDLNWVRFWTRATLITQLNPIYNLKPHQPLAKFLDRRSCLITMISLLLWSNDQIEDTWHSYLSFISLQTFWIRDTVILNWP